MSDMIAREVTAGDPSGEETWGISFAAVSGSWGLVGRALVGLVDGAGVVHRVCRGSGRRSGVSVSRPQPSSHHWERPTKIRDR